MSRPFKAPEFTERYFEQKSEVNRPETMDRILQLGGTVNHEPLFDLPAKKVLLLGGKVVHDGKHEVTEKDKWKIIWRVHILSPAFNILVGVEAKLGDISWLNELEELTTK